MFDWSKYPNLCKVVVLMDVDNGHIGMFSQSPDLDHLETVFKFDALEAIATRALSTNAVTLLKDPEFYDIAPTTSVAMALTAGEHGIAKEIIESDAEFYALSVFLDLLFDTL